MSIVVSTINTIFDIRDNEKDRTKSNEQNLTFSTLALTIFHLYNLV